MFQLAQVTVSTY